MSTQSEFCNKLPYYAQELFDFSEKIWNFTSGNLWTSKWSKIDSPLSLRIFDGINVLEYKFHSIEDKEKTSALLASREKIVEMSFASCNIRTINLIDISIFGAQALEWVTRRVAGFIAAGTTGLVCNSLGYLVLKIHALACKCFPKSKENTPVITSDQDINEEKFPPKEKKEIVLDLVSSKKEESKKIDKPIISFYRGEGADCEKRRIDEIWNWDVSKKESAHDYIQWLFPLKEMSKHNPRAPILDEEMITIMKNDETIIYNLKTSFATMMKFYGLQYTYETRSVEFADNFTERAKVWLTPGNHNFLRITRILTCLKIFDLHEEATCFLNILTKIKDKYPCCQSSYAFWVSA